MTPAPSAAEAVVETIVWRGLIIEITYVPDWLNSAASEYRMSHLEIRSISPERAALPMTETGHRSHFMAHGIVEDAGGPVAYITAWLEHDAKLPSWRRLEARQRQLDLFR